MHLYDENNPLIQGVSRSSDPVVAVLQIGTRLINRAEQHMRQNLPAVTLRVHVFGRTNRLWDGSKQDIVRFTTARILLDVPRVSADIDVCHEHKANLAKGLPIGTDALNMRSARVGVSDSVPRRSRISLTLACRSMLVGIEDLCLQWRYILGSPEIPRSRL